MISDETGHLRETVVDRQTIFDGRMLHVYKDTVTLPSGRTGTKEVIGHPGAAGIVALTGDGGVVLVRQWRHAAGRALWEIPAGCLEPDEPPLECAQRELAEETGYTAARWRAVGQGHVSPGCSNEVIHLFVAEGLTLGSTNPDADELLDIQTFTVAEVRGLIESDQVDLKTIAGLARAGIDLHA